MKGCFLLSIICATTIFASETKIDNLSGEQAAMMIHVAAVSGEALKLDGVLGSEKANKKCSLLFERAGAGGEIKSKMVEICTNVASGKDTYFTK